MRYLMNVLDDGAGRATGTEAAAIDAFNDRLRTEGYWLFAEGLSAPADAVVLDERDGHGLVTDGPFVEAEEWVAGFWIIDVPDRDAALALATEASRSCNRRIELRAILSEAEAGQTKQAG